MKGARRWIASARATLAAGFPESATGDAYYAALYAARAALSEEGRHAKTHGGTWDLLYRLFVATGRLDQALYSEARRIERLRLDAHYEALEVPSHDAERSLRAAEQLLAAIERTLRTPEESQ